jgi:hypothetical protein
VRRRRCRVFDGLPELLPGQTLARSARGYGDAVPNQRDDFCGQETTPRPWRIGIGGWDSPNHVLVL